MITAKQEAKETIEKLPSTATWDEIFYELYVRQKISIGLHAADNGEIVLHDDVKKKFGIQ